MRWAVLRKLLAITKNCMRPDKHIVSNGAVFSDSRPAFNNYIVAYNGPLPDAHKIIQHHVAADLCRV